MKICLENIGKIKDCKIELNGITVIAGENNTGKSTIGKTLYSIYRSFHDISETIIEIKINSISRALRGVDFLSDIPDGKIETAFLEKAKDKTVVEIEQMIIELGRRSGQYNPELNLQPPRDAAQDIYDIVNVSDDKLMSYHLKRNLSYELGSNIGNVNHPNEKSSIEIYIKGDKVTDIVLDKNIEINKYTNYVKEIIYIDDPFVLDSIQPSIRLFFTPHGHKWDLISLLRSEKEPDLIDELITKQKLDGIYEKLSEVCEGKLVNKQRSWLYHSTKFKEDLDLRSLSAGIKNFLVLRTLLEKGAITTNGIVIMDEPEINLHPAWQLIFAEILVLLHKEFGLNILLNTHSPYFLNAIETYSKQYEITRKCKYYMTKNDGDWADVEDVTDKIDAIYKLLADPLQQLEDLADE